MENYERTRRIAALLTSGRLRAGLTQEQVAVHAGVSVRTVRNVERAAVDRPRASTVGLIARALGTAEREWARLLDTDEHDAEAQPAAAPADPAGFVGRHSELARLTAMVSGEGSRLAIVSGLPGVGKTALVLQWCRQVAFRFPRHPLFVNLRGSETSTPPLRTVDIARTILEGLDVPMAHQPISAAETLLLCRRTLMREHVLIILDNASGVEQLRPVLPSLSRSLVVVTSRNMLTELRARPDALAITLDPPTPAMARQMLACQMGRHRLDAEAAAVEAVIQLSARSPLALRIIGARAAQRAGTPLASLAQEMGEVQRRAGCSPWITTGTRTAFAWSYSLLSAAAKRLYGLLTTHPGGEMSTGVAASLAASRQAPTRRWLEELAAAHLLIERAPGRFEFHDVLRPLAVEVAAKHVDTDDRGQAVQRMVAYYEGVAAAAHRLLPQGRVCVKPSPPPAGVQPGHLSSPSQAMEWFRLERASLVAIVGMCGSLRLDEQAWRLAWYVGDYLEWYGSWDDLNIVLETGLTAARRLSNAFAHDGMIRRLAAINEFRTMPELVAARHSAITSSSYVDIGLAVARYCHDLRRSVH